MAGMTAERPEVTEDWLLQTEMALVYYPHGRMAHVMRMEDVNARYGDGPVCKTVPSWHEPYGTGTQDEWERARALPLCRLCAVYWRGAMS